MAVSAIEADGRVAPYSNGGVGIGRIDIAAPGSGVFSSVPRPQLYRTLIGTSMACPHVAGIAALWAKTSPVLRGQRLWDQLVAAAEPLAGQSAVDIGKGLVKAPRCIISNAMAHSVTQRAKKPEELTSFIVTVHDRDAIGSIALKLEAIGIDVELVMKRTGVLGGRGPVRLFPKITALPGVKHAREEHGCQLPPLHDSIPQ